MFIKLNKSNVLTKFNNEASGFRPEMFKERGKYIEVPVKEVKAVTYTKGKDKESVTKMLVKPDMNGVIFSRFPPYGELSGHTILLIINPRIAAYAEKAQMYILEESDLENMGGFVIPYFPKQGKKHVSTDDWMYRIYALLKIYKSNV